MATRSNEVNRYRGARLVRALPYQFSFGDFMHVDELIDNLVLDYYHYREKRDKAFFRGDTEYVATLDDRLVATRKKLDAVMQVKQDEQYLGEYEKPPIGWAVYKCDDIRSESEYIMPQKPTVADWRRVAARYAETGNKEDYDLMLSLVSLDHPVPNLWGESETVKTTSKTTKPLTLADVWYGTRWYLFIFLVWLLSIVI